MTPPARFNELLIALARELDAPPPPAISMHDPTVVDFEVDDVRMTLVYAPRERPAQILCTCVLGPVPQMEPAPVLRRLLELGFLLAGSETSVGVDPTGEDVMLLLHAPLASVSATSVLASMQALAAVAMEWRAHHFLAPAAAPGLLADRIARRHV